MITFQNTKIKILIVPDFDGRVDTEAMLAIYKKAGGAVKIIDLRQIVVDEHPGETLTEPQIIDLCARKLEQLASDKTIYWENYHADCEPFDLSGYDLTDKVDTYHDVVTPEEVEKKNLLIMEEMKSIRHILPKTREDPVEKTFVVKTSGGMRQFRIKITREDREIHNTGSPDVLVIFGKSAMLAGGIEGTPILFINPEYDEESPWTSHYYIDRKGAQKFYASFREKAELDNTQSQLALALEDYGASGWEQPKRIGLFTDADTTDIKEFDLRYPHLAMSDPDLRDTSALAKAVCDFCREKIETPRFDIDRLLLIPEHKNKREALIVKLPHPLDLRDGRKLLAVELEACSQYRMPGKVVHVEGRSFPQSLDSIRDRRDLAALRDAMRKGVEAMPQKKRILIVEDYMSPSPSPTAELLSKELQIYGHYVPVMLRGNGLKDSRASLERRCKRKHFDLVVTLETGCLLAGRMTDINRIFVNPNWRAWSDMRKLDFNRKEWEMALNMGAKRNLPSGGSHWTLGWFTADMADSDEVKEHVARFGDAAFPPSIGLTDKDGIRAIAQHINDILH